MVIHGAFAIGALIEQGRRLRWIWPFARTQDVDARRAAARATRRTQMILPGQFDVPSLLGVTRTVAVMLAERVALIEPPCVHVSPPSRITACCGHRPS
ncbi:MAG: hypothetical protein ACRD1H_15735, partial [Vicinamibacterales bacterium]